MSLGPSEEELERLGTRRIIAVEVGELDHVTPEALEAIVKKHTGRELSVEDAQDEGLL